MAEKMVDRKNNLPPRLGRKIDAKKIKAKAIMDNTGMGGGGANIKQCGKAKAGKAGV